MPLDLYRGVGGEVIQKAGDYCKLSIKNMLTHIASIWTNAWPYMVTYGPMYGNTLG